MLRYQLIVVGSILAVSLSRSAKGEEGETTVSVAASPVVMKIPEGFLLQGRLLALPNKQTLEDVTGLQEFYNKTVLIVRQSSVCLYSRSQKRYVELPLPTPVVTTTEKRGNQTYSVVTPVALSASDYELTLIPFDAVKSNDPKAGSRTAFIGFKGAEKTRIGIYRYQAGQSTVEYLPIFGGGRVPGCHLSWNTFMADAPRETAIRINLDRSEEPRPGNRHGYYSLRPKKKFLKCVFPESPEQAAARLAAHRDTIKIVTEKPAASKSPDE